MSKFSQMQRTATTHYLSSNSYFKVYSKREKATR